MKEWYERYYIAIATSVAYSTFCKRVFGLDFGQHGFADMAQVNRLVDALRIHTTDRVVDLGCGVGGITATIARSTGANVIGVDYIENAIRLAKARHGGSGCNFFVSDIGANALPSECADVLLSIDAIYFHPLPQIVAEMKRLLAPKGRMGILYTHRAEGEPPYGDFDRSELLPDSTPLAAELHAQGLRFDATDLTSEDYSHALLKKRVLEELRDLFVAEGNEFLFDNRYAEANGAIQSIEDEVHIRTMYIATKEGA